MVSVEPLPGLPAGPSVRAPEGTRHITRSSGVVCAWQMISLIPRRSAVSAVRMRACPTSHLVRTRRTTTGRR
eukprot:scaffold144845_cov157-Phaeocystis_antarctica.AAC.1